VGKELAQVVLGHVVGQVAYVQFCFRHESLLREWKQCSSTPPLQLIPESSGKSRSSPMTERLDKTKSAVSDSAHYNTDYQDSQTGFQKFKRVV
jgi:hypothetical protein